MKHTLSLLLTALLLQGCISETSQRIRQGEAAPRAVLSPLWEKPLFTYSRFSPIPEQFGSPVFSRSGQIIYLATSKGDVVALSDSGRGLWKRSFKDSFQTAPALFEPIDLLVIGSLGGSLYGLSPKTGKQLWKFQGFGSFMAGFAYNNGVIYATTSKNMLYAITADTGDLHWSRRNETLSGFTVKGHSAPVIDGKLLYMGLSDGRLQALDITRRGTLVWSKTLENPDKENYIDSDADPLIDGDTLYTASYRNGVVALEKDSGDLLWKFPAYGVTSLSIVRDHIYFVSPRDGIHCLTLSGKLVWKQHVDYGTPKKLLIRGRRMFIAFDLGGLIAIDPVTGFFFQRFDTGAGISGNPSIHGNRLATFANNGKLYLFQIK